VLLGNVKFMSLAQILYYYDIETNYRIIKNTGKARKDPTIEQRDTVPFGLYPTLKYLTRQRDITEKNTLVYLSIESITKSNV